MADLLNAGITPVVREFGSLGCSGDLAPLAHIALTLMGEGERASALAEAGIEPVVLEEKEGLALINGTEGMLAMLLLSLHDLHLLVTTADITAAMSVEASLGTDRVTFDLKRPDTVWVDGAPAALSQASPLLILPGSMFGPDQDDYLRVAFANVEAKWMPEIAERLARDAASGF